MASGAQAIVELLEAEGVEVCFGLPGVHNLALWEALRESSIRLVGVRHEQAAAYAADGYSRASGRLGVALTTTGPGAANTLAAVGEAALREAKGVGGHVEHREVGVAAFEQPVDQGRRAATPEHGRPARLGHSLS